MRERQGGPWPARLLCLLMLLLVAGCGMQRVRVPAVVVPPPPAGGEESAAGETLGTMGYTIQAGAFANLDNAVRLMEALQKEGLEAYYFRQNGLFKVRFGDFPTDQQARQRAAALRRAGIIDVFYIVSPEEYTALRDRRHGCSATLREKLIETAEQFLGIPYKWGGESADDGFDCSGLTMAVYRLNGLCLPRNSRQQFSAGRPVNKEELRPGDLVFFATKGGQRVTHVGIYLGRGRFIHAPRTGKTIRIASLASPYFASHFCGGRSYLAPPPQEKG